MGGFVVGLDSFSKKAEIGLDFGLSRLWVVD